MARSKKETRRGSPEAIAKRRAARSLNRLFDRGAAGGEAMDGRTLKRKRRLLQELQEGRKGEPLKAHEVLSYTTELMGYGENLTSIRKLKPLLPPAPPLTADTLSTIRATQESYAFDPRAWKLLGIDIEDVMGGGPSSAEPKKKRAAKKGRKKAAS